MAAASSEPPRQHITSGALGSGCRGAGCMILGSELPAELPAVRQISSPPTFRASPCFVVLAAWFVGSQNVTTDEIRTVTQKSEQHHNRMPLIALKRTREITFTHINKAHATPPPTSDSMARLLDQSITMVLSEAV